MESKWSTLHKALFLFFGIYFFLYILNNVSEFHKIIRPLWEFLIPPFSQFLDYEKTITYSVTRGDYVYDFFKICLSIPIAIFATIFILLIDYKRENYNKQLHWLTVCIRYFICYKMLAFGVVKFYVYGGQFPALTDAHLTTTLRDMSPSVLFFNFMRYSKSYVILAGMLEVGGGLLLLSRRTVTMGALILLGVMLNVLMVNLCYNFVQKILSLHLVFMLLCLILLDAKGLYQFFILRKSAQPYTNSIFLTPVINKIRLVMKFVVIIYVFNYFIFSDYERFFTPKESIETLTGISKFFGVYNVKQNAESKDGFPLTNLPDSLNWKVFYQSTEDRVRVKTKNDKLINLVFKPDIEKQLFQLKYLKEDDFYQLSYEHIDTNSLRLNGNLAGNQVDFIMHRISDLQYLHNPQTKYRLINDEFKWISD